MKDEKKGKSKKDEKKRKKGRRQSVGANPRVCPEKKSEPLMAMMTLISI